MLVNVAVRTTVIYLLVLARVRLSGKRVVGQITRFDLTAATSPQQFPTERADRAGPTFWGAREFRKNRIASISTGGTPVAASAGSYFVSVTGSGWS